MLENIFMCIQIYIIRNLLLHGTTTEFMYIVFPLLFADLLLLIQADRCNIGE